MKAIIPAIILVCSTLSPRAQVTFQDLDFESASVPPNSTGQQISATSALPGWSVAGTMLYNEQPYVPGESQQQGMFLVGPGPNLSSFQPIDGLYSLVIQGGQNGDFSLGFYISQSGVIPSDAKFLQFKAWSPGAFDFYVTLGGSTLPLTAVSTEPNYTLFQANIQSLAGQNAALSFVEPAYVPPVELDDITFSTAPEPNTVIMIVVGGLIYFSRQILSWRSAHKISN